MAKSVPNLLLGFCWPFFCADPRQPMTRIGPGLHETLRNKSVTLGTFSQEWSVRSAARKLWHGIKGSAPALRRGENVLSSKDVRVYSRGRLAALAAAIVLLPTLSAIAHACVRRHNATASFTVTPGSGPPPLLVQVDGSGSLPAHGTLVSWTWDWGDGSAGASGVTSSHSYAATGTYKITLTVVDSGDANGPATTGVLSQNVNCLTAANAPPTAQITSAGPLIGDAPLLVSFTGLGQDAAPPGDILEHRWDFGDGSATVVYAGMTPGSSTSPTHTYTTAGFYVVVFRVTDHENVWQEATTNVNPTWPGRPHAVLGATPTSGPPPLTVTVDGSASFDSRGTITAYNWDWGDQATASGAHASHVYPIIGTYTIRLSVTNNIGVVDSTTLDVSAVPAGKLIPSAHIQSAIPQTGHAPLSITFLGHGHDDTEPLVHRWDFGDGSAPLIYDGIANHANTAPTHLYTTPGAYTCTLRVTDPMNLSGATSMTVTVENPGQDVLGKRSCGGTGAEAALAVLFLWVCRRMHGGRARKGPFPA
jgi:PKD repeat protein